MADTGRGLDRDEVLATAFSLFGAGFDTTRHLIGNAVHAQLCQPNELARLRREPSLVRAAVEELLRYDGSVQFTMRTALKDFSLDGEQFHRGDTMLLCLGAANRDPTVYEMPDRLDVGRQRVQPITFGGGIHVCPGAAMGRLEGRLAIGLLARTSELCLAGIPVWRKGWVFRGLDSLPVHAA